ncbi:MAG: MBL fold metallo-hydrolase [Rhodospirillales bacterium]|nr:MAG: MBL fold metallo-hydrolase [Rhodospirillales bacterium]
MAITLQFFGAAGTVTGSCMRLTTPEGEIVVDCGLFQGSKTLQELNYREPPVSPSRVAAVLLTHAHLDHTGLFPKLVVAGFRRRAYATPGTCDLSRWMLPDSGAIQEAEVERLNRRRDRRGSGRVEPIYTRADAEAAVERFAPTPFDEAFSPLPGVTAVFRRAGHILGAAFVETTIDTPDGPLRLTFSGDIGPPGQTLQRDPVPPAPADFAVLESTYGDRVRERRDEEQRRDRLRGEITDALAAGGNVLIPAFAVERTQELLHDLLTLMRRGRLPHAPVFLDSPLAHRATEVFRKHQRELDLDSAGDPFGAANVSVTRTPDESKAIGRVKSGAIIVAGSGMCEAGRIKYHLKDHLWRPQSTVLFIGYQAAGTLGRLIRDGAPTVRIHGETVEVRARVRAIGDYSGHGDRDDLVNWIRPTLPTLGALFLTHGEPAARDGLSSALQAAGFAADRVVQPRLDSCYALEKRDGVWRAAMIDGGCRLDAPQVEAATRGRDWQSDFAEILLDLEHRLDRAADDRSRRKILRDVRRALDSVEPR